MEREPVAQILHIKTLAQRDADADTHVLSIISTDPERAVSLAAIHAVDSTTMHLSTPAEGIRIEPQPRAQQESANTIAGDVLLGAQLRKGFDGNCSNSTLHPTIIVLTASRRRPLEKTNVHSAAQMMTG